MTLRSLFARRGLARGLALAISMVLVACGGQVASTSNSAGGSTTAPVIPLTDVTGLFSGSVSGTGAEFLSLITPNGSQVNWYGWYFLRGDGLAPYLYSGSLALSTGGVAQSAANALWVSEAGVRHSASASLTQGSSSGFKAEVTVNRTDAPSTPFTLTANALPTSAYSAKAAANTSVLAGSWTGVLSSGLSTYQSILQFDSSGKLIRNSAQWECALDNVGTALQLNAASGGNFYTASVTIPARSGCVWAPLSNAKSLAGAAVVQRLASGEDQLDMILIDGTGDGISYRGRQRK